MPYIECLGMRTFPDLPNENWTRIEDVFPYLNMGIFQCYVSLPEGRSDSSLIQQSPACSPYASKHLVRMYLDPKNIPKTPNLRRYIDFY